MKVYCIADDWHCGHIVLEAGIFSSRVHAEKTSQLINGAKKRSIDAAVLPLEFHTEFITLSTDEIARLYT